MTSYLIVANQTMGGSELIEDVRLRMEAGPCDFHLVVPATPPKNTSPGRKARRRPSPRSDSPQGSTASGRCWGRTVAGHWEATVANSLASVKQEAERRASRS